MPKNEKAPERWMRKWEVDEKGETSVYAKDDFSGKENNFEGYSAKKKAMILRARRRIRMQAQAKQTRRATSPRRVDQDAEDRESWRELPGDLKPALKDVFRKCRDLHSAIAYHLQYTDLSNETYALGRSIAENCRVLWQQLEPFFYVEGPLAHGLSAGAQYRKIEPNAEGVWPNTESIDSRRRPGHLGAFLNTPEDMQWLREVHLPELDPKFQAAQLYGNEDSPVQIECYESADPELDEEPEVWVLVEQAEEEEE